METAREELAGMGLAFPGMVNPKEKRVTSTNVNTMMPVT